MTTNGRTTAVGVFTDRALGDNALEALRKAGFTDDQLGFVTREGAVAPVSDLDTPHGESNVPGAAAGAVGGGVIGGLIGAAAALLIPGLGPAIAGGILGGVAIGALTGGFAGSLVSLGVPDEEARYYQEQLAAGRTILTVTSTSSDRYQEAVTIMRQNGASDAVVRTDMPDLDNEGSPTAGIYNADRHPDDLPAAMLPGSPAIGIPATGGGVGTPYAPGAAMAAAAWPVPSATDQIPNERTTPDEPTEDYDSYSKRVQVEPTAYDIVAPANDPEEQIATDQQPVVTPDYSTEPNPYDSTAPDQVENTNPYRDEATPDKGPVFPPAPEQRGPVPADSYPETSWPASQSEQAGPPEYRPERPAQPVNTRSAVPEDQKPSEPTKPEYNNAPQRAQ